MSVHRFHGFFEDYFHQFEVITVTLDDKNSELNQVMTDRLKLLQSALEEYEASLRKLGIPRDVWHTYRRENKEDENGNCFGDTDYTIGMVKYGGSWRLCHGVFDNWGNGSSDIKPVVDSPIPIRIEVVKHLEALRHEIVESKKRLIPKIDDAIQAVTEALRSPNPWSNVPRKKGSFTQPNSLELLHADVIQAKVDDETDIVVVWRTSKAADGETKVISVAVQGLDGLFALQLLIRNVRGDQGLITKKVRTQQLVDLAKADEREFLRIVKRRKGFLPFGTLTKERIRQLATEIAEEEIAWESA